VAGTKPRRCTIAIVLAKIGYWIGLLIPAASYAIYPAAVSLWARLRPPARAAVDQLPWPSVTVAVAAHNEEATIARCVHSLLDQSYPGPPVQVLVGLDGCTDGTAAVLASIGPTRLGVLDLPRMGKATTDNRLVERASTEVVVTTSAGSEFAVGTLERLVEPLRDARVGCATGVFRPRPDGSGASEGEGAYWRAEYAVMAAESRLGILAVASGTALAFRRSLFRPIPADSDADVTIAPTVLANGGRVVHVHEAVVFDDGPGSLRVSLRQRRRMVLRALPATIAILPRLVRTGHLMAALGLVNHKVFRWLSPIAAGLWAVSAAVLVADGSREYVVLTVAVVVAGMASAGLVLATSRAGRRAMVGLAVAQIAFALGVVDAVRGRRARTWNREAR
jgi:cellulose synthase/poly-beta-1,6-N-acetylglucosamine synthase-like glycosyltransferase